MHNNIYCIGRNYLEHAKELGNDIEARPVVFSKPNTSLITSNIIELPTFSKDIHFETELVIKISKDCFKITEEAAESFYDEIGIGLDLTARDLQSELKEKRLPWLLSKGFKGACFCSKFINKELLSKDVGFSMTLNDIERQKSNSGEMIFAINKIISFISEFIQLESGDLIYTGTPKGVGRLTSGDTIKLFIEGNLMAELIVE